MAVLCSMVSGMKGEDGRMEMMGHLQLLLGGLDTWGPVTVRVPANSGLGPSVLCLF